MSWHLKWFPVQSESEMRSFTCASHAKDFYKEVTLVMIECFLVVCHAFVSGTTVQCATAAHHWDSTDIVED